MRTPIIFEPLREVEQWQRQIEQLLDDSNRARQQNPQSDVKPGEREWRVAIEFGDRGAEFLLRAEVPGIEGKELDVQVSRTRVAIAGERHPHRPTPERRNLGSELRYGKFNRVVELPKPVASDRVKAELKNGILTLILPKLESQQPKVVKVQVGKAETAPTNPAPVVDPAPKVEQAPPPQAENKPLDLEVTADLWATPA